jgi:hypothetical protein
VDKKIDVVYPGKHVRSAGDKSDTFAALDFFRIRTMIAYAVIDTNVIVSAMLSSHDDAATVRVVEKLFTGEIIPLRDDFNCPAQRATF